MPPNQPSTPDFVVEKPRPKAPTLQKTLVDVKFLMYGGEPGLVNNWQAIALAGLDIANELGVRLAEAIRNQPR